jgi:hypothetical protein
VARRAGPVFLVAGGEAAEDLVAAVWPNYMDAEGRSPEAAAAVERVREWSDGEFEDLVRLAAARTPVARDVLQRVLDAQVERQVAAVRSVVEGLSRFSRRVLGLEGLEVIRAWMPVIAARVDALPPLDVAFDESYAVDVERTAWKYWHKMVRSGD